MFIVFRFTLLASLCSLLITLACGATILAITYRLGGFYIAWHPFKRFVLFSLMDIGFADCVCHSFPLHILPFGAVATGKA